MGHPLHGAKSGALNGLKVMVLNSKSMTHIFLASAKTELSSDWDWDLGTGTWDLGPGTWDLGPGT